MTVVEAVDVAEIARQLKFLADPSLREIEVRGGQVPRLPLQTGWIANLITLALELEEDGYTASGRLQFRADEYGGIDVSLLLGTIERSPRFNL